MPYRFVAFRLGMGLHFLMLMDLLTGQPLRWMAAISVRSNVRLALKKTSRITNDNGLGRSRGGYGTKIHMATDGSVIPLNIVLSAGQAHESLFALRLLDGIGVQRQNGSMKRRGKSGRSVVQPTAWVLLCNSVTCAFPASSLPTMSCHFRHC